MQTPSGDDYPFWASVVAAVALFGRYLLRFKKELRDDGAESYTVRMQREEIKRLTDRVNEAEERAEAAETKMHAMRNELTALKMENYTLKKS